MKFITTMTFEQYTKLPKNVQETVKELINHTYRQLTNSINTYALCTRKTDTSSKYWDKKLTKARLKRDTFELALRNNNLFFLLNI